MDEQSSKHSFPTKSEIERIEIERIEREFSSDGPDTYDRRVPGEPEFPRIIWDIPDAEDEHTIFDAMDHAREEVWQLRGLALQQQRTIRWLRQENERLRLRTGESHDSAAVAEIKQRTVQTLRELLPQAHRAAKRGKPALLRLIVRTIKTKL